MSDYPCPYCKQPRGADWRDKMNKRRGDNIRKALSKVDEKGRPRKADYQMVETLSKKGFSQYEIARILGVSRGAVQHALRSKV